MKKYNKYYCNVCGEDSLVNEGFHLKYNLDFCSYRCIANWCEKQEALINKYQFPNKQSRGKKK